MKHLSYVLLVLVFSAHYTNGQKLTEPLVSSNLQQIVAVPNTDTTLLMTYPGLNAFIQKRVNNYLTGSSDLSLSKIYAAYTSENDKLNLGFNIPIDNPYTGRLVWVLNPVLETDLKKGFATLYKDTSWVNNLRAGVKLTYIIPWGSVNFFKDRAKSKRNQLYDFRFKKLQEAQNKIKASMTRKERNKLFAEYALEEANYVDEIGAYTWVHTAWISFWGFTPLSKTENYIAANANQLFETVDFKLSDINLQVNYLREYKCWGIFYGSFSFRSLENNSASAGLMTSVDFNSYSILPGFNSANLSTLTSAKAFIGDFKRFKTNTYSFQFVYFSPLPNALIRPGLSFRYDINKGDYDPVNYKIGIPLTIRGKEKPFNIELQYIRDDINNFADKSNPKPKRVVGINLGYPIIPLYK